jgi:hypothetical protein
MGWWGCTRVAKGEGENNEEVRGADEERESSGSREWAQASVATLFSFRNSISAREKPNATGCPE